MAKLESELMRRLRFDTGETNGRRHVLGVRDGAGIEIKVWQVGELQVRAPNPQNPKHNFFQYMSGPTTPLGIQVSVPARS